MATHCYSHYDLSFWVMLCNLLSAVLHPLRYMWRVWLDGDKLKLAPKSKRGHCLPPLGLTPEAAIKNAPPQNSSWSMGLVLCHSEESLLCWIQGMSAWAPCRLERSDVLVGQREGNNEDMVCKALQTWSAPLSGAQQQQLECWHCLGSSPGGSWENDGSRGNGHSLSPDWN